MKNTTINTHIACNSGISQRHSKKKNTLKLIQDKWTISNCGAFLKIYYK